MPLMTRKEKPAGFSVKCSKEFRAWLESFCEHRRSGTSDTIEQAVVMLAAREKFSVPPPSRMPRARKGSGGKP